MYHNSKKFPLFFIPCTFLVLFLVSPCFSQPSVNSVSGSLFHNGIVTIDGNNFGIKAQAAPVAWDDFEDGVVDTKATQGTWESVQHLSINSLAGEQRHALSKYNGKYGFGGGTAGYSGGTNQYGKWFGSYWFKLDPNWVWGRGVEGAHLGNVKIFRIWASGSGSDNSGAVIHTYLNQDVLWIFQEACTGGGGDIPIIARLTKGVWHQFQFEYSEGSAQNAADGIIKVYFDGKMITQVTNLGTRCTGSDTQKRVSLLGFYNSWGSSPTYYYWQDDSYIDNTWARVEIGNSPTYSSCTHREIQIPVAWSNTSISARMNQGSFQTGDTVYLFVVSENGVVNSNGYPITIQNAVPAPSAPKGLRIVN